ncbi:stage III sporulation protein AE [Salipaludibacillus sp. LMS25]|jgi:stage III sporulation protein AE|uniref:stage III sporulation protein AE n=1 Tax=Salipaludibacillus sp. LMS25 TaxID=2924031 RepID=UPI0020D0227A|nr:stage III sporulation protein AE [Salipaludibacillus sp. LMS25]UTR14481.1 stage III sporulation protein AE [Salipaludibacillus sp. LMS25]
MKRITIVCFFLSFFFTFTGTSLAEEEDLLSDEGLMEEQINKLDLEEIGDFWDVVRHEYDGFLPETQKKEFTELFRSDGHFSITEWLKSFLTYFFHEIITHGRLMGTLILLTVFSLILVHLQQAFEKHTISKVAYAVTYMVLMIIALNSFYVAVELTESTISTMSHFMTALIPLILVLMATVGSITSVSLFHPIIMFIVHTSGLFVQYFILPLLLLSTILSIVSTMTDHYKVSKLANLLRTIAVGSLGIFLTVFLGVMSVQGAAAAVTDGIAVRTAKFVTGNFIPVVGRMFTDAADTVMGASLLLKNTIGILGLLILLIVCTFPALKVLAISVIYSFASAILQPLGGGPVIECLAIIGKNILFVFATLAAVSLMFFLSISIMIISGNLSIMLR